MQQQDYKNEIENVTWPFDADEILSSLDISQSELEWFDAMVEKISNFFRGNNSNCDQLSKGQIDLPVSEWVRMIGAYVRIGGAYRPLVLINLANAHKYFCELHDLLPDAFAENWVASVEKLYDLNSSVGMHWRIWDAFERALDPKTREKLQDSISARIKLESLTKSMSEKRERAIKYMEELEI
jgi:hypothetical protein